jgi:hypothetical protein
MRPRCSLQATGIFILIIALGTADARAAAPGDACALLSPAQLSAALVLPMDAGKYVTPGYVRTCTWTPSGGATPAIKFVTLFLLSADDYRASKSVMQAAQSKGGNAVTSVNGVGDDAYFTSIGSSVTSLMVKKGAVAFKLSLYGATAPDKAMAIEKTLASQALANL